MAIYVGLGKLEVYIEIDFAQWEPVWYSDGNAGLGEMKTSYGFYREKIRENVMYDTWVPEWKAR